MTGNSSQRRKALRAKERLSKRSEGRYPWLESALAQPEKPAEAEDAILITPEPPRYEFPLQDEYSDTPKPIAPPEPRGEAEGALDEIVLCDACGLPASIVRPGKWECRNAGCSENVEDGGALYRDLEEARKDIADGKTLTHDEAFIEPPKKRRTLWNWLRKLVGR